MWTRNQMIREALSDGAAMSAEISASLNIASRSARVGLWVLMSQGHICKVGSVKSPGQGPMRKLYDLTPRGRRALQRDRAKREVA